MAADKGVFVQLGLRLLVLSLGAAAVIVGLRFAFRPQERNALECRFADGTALVATFEDRPRCWPRFGVKTLRLSKPPRYVGTLRLVSTFPDDRENVEEYDLYLADGHRYLLRREATTPASGALGKEITGEWYELLPLQVGAVADNEEPGPVLHAAANQLAALAYGPEVRLRPLR